MERPLFCNKGHEMTVTDNPATGKWGRCDHPDCNIPKTHISELLRQKSASWTPPEPPPDGYMLIGGKLVSKQRECFELH